VRAINGKRSFSAVSAEYFNMKFKKVILVLTEDTDQIIITQVVKLCKKFRSKLFVLFVIEVNRASRLARLTHQKTDILDQEIEEGGWKLLYLVEDLKHMILILYLQKEKMRLKKYLFHLQSQ
jgi:hypothetical protein